MQNDNDMEVDLHGLSFGTTYFYLKKEFSDWIKKSPDKMNLILVYGKGLHRKGNEEEVHAVKQAVEKVVNEMLDHLSHCSEDKQNTGRYSLSLQRKELEKGNIHQGSKSKETESDSTISLKGALNPHAEVFTPGSSFSYSRRFFGDPVASQVSSSMQANLNPHAKVFIPGSIQVGTTSESIVKK